MKDINKSIFINAAPSKVWDSMLTDETYPKWADVFSPDGSGNVKTDWKQNSVIDFTDNTGAGMRAHISQSDYPKYFEVTIDAELKSGGEVDTENPYMKDMIGSKEHYTFTEKDGGTQLDIHSTMDDQWYDDMTKAWDTALQKVKNMAEQE